MIKGFTVIEADCDFTIDQVIEVFKQDGIEAPYGSHIIVTCQGAEALAMLQFLLNHEDVSVQRWSAITLGWLKDINVIPQLIEASQNGEITACKEAIHLLGELKAQQAVEPLLQILQSNTLVHSRRTVKRGVIEALGKIGDVRALFLLKELKSELEKKDVAPIDNYTYQKALLTLNTAIDSITQQQQN